LPNPETTSPPQRTPAAATATTTHAATQTAKLCSPDPTSAALPVTLHGSPPAVARTQHPPDKPARTPGTRDIDQYASQTRSTSSPVSPPRPRASNTTFRVAHHFHSR